MTSALPSHLAGHAPMGLVPEQPIAQWELGALRNFVYLILDWSTRAAAIVDPQRDLSEPLRALAAHGFRLERVLLTHTHHDHVAGLPGLAERDPELPVTLHADDRHRLSRTPPKRLVELEDGSELRVGSLRLRALHTPGHSAGAISYEIPANQPGIDRPYLFTGDTVFIRDCGRTDLETGSNEQMFRSLQRIRTLDPATVLLPGHHYAPECATTLERELLESPPFRARSVEELANLP